MEIGAIFGGNFAKRQVELLHTRWVIRRGIWHGDERDVVVRSELLNEFDCIGELLPEIKLELDEPTLALLSPVAVFFKHEFDILWYAT